MILTVMFISCLLLPAMMLIFGFIMYKHTPRHGNVAFGYRSTASMRSPETWKFANEYCGKIWMILGAVLFAAVVAMFACMRNYSDDAVSKTGAMALLAETALLLVTIFPVENALRKRFDKDGKPIDKDKR